MGTQDKLQIDSLHCRAICDEIGLRLRAILDRESPAIPAYLRSLMEQLAENDRQSSPSIVEDIVWQPTPVAHLIGLACAA